MKKASANSKLRIIVLGYVVRCPIGGRCWCDLHYLLGLMTLGHDVYFYEDSGDHEWCCYDPSKNITSSDPSYGLKFIKNTFSKFGLADRWIYHDALRSAWHGPCVNGFHDIIKSADVVLNLGGVNPLRPWLMDVPVRVLIDKDPVFTQIWHLTDPRRKELSLKHTAFMTFGENIGHNHCTIPDDGLPWQKTRHPICLEYWPETTTDSNGKFTTVMQWESYPKKEYGGTVYGMKSDSFYSYMTLPQKTNCSLELSVGSPTAPRESLRKAGWIVCNPLETARDPRTYQQYIQQSKAEFSIAKHGYVVTRSGWFSERSASYMASGRPVIVQDTGFSDWMAIEGGVFLFNTPEEALSGLHTVNAHYKYHCNAARETAKEYFCASKVLTPLLDSAMHYAKLKM